ncbi:methyl-accepting chemotaxis protein [Curvibacter lanceolatus]|uniref:methyl-accepting chemotaxis protein n=1 Tax=Curvibacter lanceolatus TaxID=86182 RepID=UPI0003815A26|nr:methyl-accepting chemotaxis protein [Curvibacter lanceolatus]
MNSLRQLKIGARLGVAFAAVLLLLALLGGFGTYQTSQANFYAKDLGTNWLPSIKVIGDIRASLNRARRAGLRHLLENSPEGKLAQQKLSEDELMQKLPKLLAQFEPMIATAEEKQAYEKMRSTYEEWHALEKKQLQLSSGSASDQEAARQMAVGDNARAFSAITTAAEKLVAINVEGADKSTAAAAASYQQALIVSIGMIALAVLMGAALALVVTRSITQPLSTGVTVAEAVAQGDLTSKFDIQGRDEPADLLRALQHMNDRLVDIVGQVRLSSDSIATGSAEIATGNADLSQRTEQQASNLEETAASMEELNSTVKTNADTAQQASRLATEATQAAEQGGAVVGRVVATMQDISASSKKISDIIGVIDGIAFQTNILALNAAVEAARAGEQGRGFAVVASEVRSLAGRSAEAAKEIKSLISTSVETVESGTVLVDEAGQSMEGIVDQVKRVSQLINEISSASMEQSSGISQIGDAVNQLDQVTQQNAALVEESAAAADSLKNQSQRLAELVSVFKIDGQPNRVGQASSAALPSRQFAKAPAIAPLPKAAAPKKPSLAKAHNPALTSSAKAQATATAGGNDDWESF